MRWVVDKTVEKLPVMSRILFASSRLKQSPFSITGIPTPVFSTKSAISFTRYTKAGSVLRISFVRQCTVRALIPVPIIRLTNSSVSFWSGKRRIFAVTGIWAGSARRREVRISHRRSGFVRRLAPIPACVENGLGQPQFKSTPETSPATVRAASTACDGDEEPIW